MTRKKQPSDGPAQAFEVETGPVELDPRQLLPLFNHDLGDVFLLVASSAIRPCLSVPAEIDHEELPWDAPESREVLIKRLSELRRQGLRTTVLWIVDDLYEHFHESQLAGAKLAAISFFSSPFSPQRLRDILQIVKETDYAAQVQVEQRLVSMLESGERVVWKSKKYGTSAIFDYRRANYWFSLNGPLDFDQQTVIPTGQFAALSDPSGEFSMESRFAINGTIVLGGQIIVHRGNRQVSPQQTADMCTAVESMRTHPVIAHVRDGLIEDIKPAGPMPNPFYRVLAELFREEPRFRKIQEVGLGTNSRCATLKPGNFFPNYRHPAVIIGLGLGGHTKFHLDLMCTEMEMYCEVENRAVEIFRELGLR